MVGNTCLNTQCGGSGSTCIAALNTARKFVGYDIDNEYCKIANQRLKKTYTEINKNTMLEKMNNFTH